MAAKPKPSASDLNYTPKWIHAESIEKLANEKISAHQKLVLESKGIEVRPRKQLEKMKRKLEKKEQQLAGDSFGRSRRNKVEDTTKKMSLAKLLDDDTWDPALGSVDQIEEIQEEIVQVRGNAIDAADSEFDEDLSELFQEQSASLDASGSSKESIPADKKASRRADELLNSKLSLSDFGVSSQSSTSTSNVVPVLPEASTETSSTPSPSTSSSSVTEGTSAVDEDERPEGVLSDPEFISPMDSSAERVCVRCHQLTHQGKVKLGGDVDRTDFRNALSEIIKSNPRAVILSLVDVMDFHGTLLTDLKDIVGPRHPVIFAINKVDILPKDCSNTRLNKLVRKEASGLGLWVYDVLLVSAIRGMNIRRAFEVIRTLCSSEGRDIYVVGTTNVGKSTFINSLLRKGLIKNHRQFSATTSVFPGTTLDLIDFPLPIHPRNKLYDTPGIISDNQLSAKLQFDELRLVNVKKPLKARTYKVAAGQTMMFGGGLARIDMTSGRPFYFTVFMSPTVTIHIGKTEKIEDVLRKNIGQRFSPPSSNERHEKLQWSMRIENQPLAGRGWMESCKDVVFSGLGWVAFTGCGDFTFSAWGPSNCDVRTRDCLMPWESRKSYRRFTGVAK